MPLKFACRQGLILSQTSPIYLAFPTFCYKKIIMARTFKTKSRITLKLGILTSKQRDLRIFLYSSKHGQTHSLRVRIYFVFSCSSIEHDLMALKWRDRVSLQWRDLMPLLWRDLVPTLRVTSLMTPYLLKSYLLISLLVGSSVARAYVIHSKLTYVAYSKCICNVH